MSLDFFGATILFFILKEYIYFCFLLLKLRGTDLFKISNVIVEQLFVYVIITVSIFTSH